MGGQAEHLVEMIHASGFKAGLVVSGGGIGAVHALLVRPGASRFVLDVQIPYSREAMNAYLGEVPENYCSEETARKMAAKACQQAERLTPDAPLLGIACTAALQTQHERPDADRAYLCIHSVDQTMSETVDLAPDDRAKQDEMVSIALLSLIARFVSH